MEKTSAHSGTLKPPQRYLSSLIKVRPDWIDYNNHLNMGYYAVIFDDGIDALWKEIGFGRDYVNDRGLTTYTAEFHIRYLRELRLGDAVRVSFQLIDHNDKCLHYFQEIIHEEGWVSATGEGLALHVDLSGLRVASMPADILSMIGTIMDEHRRLPRPDAVGRSIAIKR